MLTGQYVKNNIYDLAGNVFEWTMASFSTNNRENRGGSHNVFGSENPSSVRTSNTPNYTGPGLGFRVTLYL